MKNFDGEAAWVYAQYLMLLVVSVVTFIVSSKAEFWSEASAFAGLSFGLFLISLAVVSSTRERMSGLLYWAAITPNVTLVMLPLTSTVVPFTSPLSDFLYSLETLNSVNTAVPILTTLMIVVFIVKSVKKDKALKAEKKETKPISVEIEQRDMAYLTRTEPVSVRRVKSEPLELEVVEDIKLPEKPMLEPILDPKPKNSIPPPPIFG